MNSFPWRDAQNDQMLRMFAVDVELREMLHEVPRRNERVTSCDCHVSARVTSIEL